MAGSPRTGKYPRPLVLRPPAYRYLVPKVGGCTYPGSPLVIGTGAFVRWSYPQTMMERPALMVVEDDAVARDALERDLKRRFGGTYDVVAADVPGSALNTLERMRSRGDELALVLADQWLPEMTGVEVLDRAYDLFPTAQKGVLVTYGDWSTVAPLQRAAILGRIDFFLFKPWADPDEWLYPTVSEYVGRWARAHRPRFEAIQIVGERWAPRSHELRDRLSRNTVPFGFYDQASPDGRRILEANGLAESKLPVVAFFSGDAIVDPSNAELARMLGVATRPDDSICDVAIVGAGPAGLSAAVYAASEGLRTVVAEQRSLGGQAGTTSLIRNYLGFPLGVRGDELTTRAYQQALLFGAEFVFAPPAARLVARDDHLGIVLDDDGGEIRARSVVIATGVDYRSLAEPSLQSLVGRGIFYGAAVTEAQAMEGQCVAVVGGGNSAGQAAVHLAKYAAHVTLLVRGGSLAGGMSAYLVDEIEDMPKVDVKLTTEVMSAVGTTRLEAVVVRDRRSGQEETLSVGGLFVMIGGEPRTDWLRDSVRLDSRGYLVTGDELTRANGAELGWPLERPPFMFETSQPGVFAIGDVRARSVKRIASAVGEGSVVIDLVHRYLVDQRLTDGRRASAAQTSAR